MEPSRMEKLLLSLERGTRVRVTVLPLGKATLNGEAYLPADRMIHSHPYCDRMKTTRRGLERCMACRHLAVKKAVESGKPFAGRCIHGAFEAVCPVIYDGSVIAVVFVGGLWNAACPPIPGAELLWEVPDPAAYIGTAETVADYILTLAKAFPASGSTGSENRLSDAVVDYADAYYCGEITLKRLARIFYVNEKYLGRLFKKATGLPFNDYLNEKRLAKAARLLEETDGSIIGIAMDCGFNNVTYFYRLFGRKYGLAPAAYRKQRKGISN